MASKTSIEWCDSTWNPLRGCSRVSEGCRNCYAEKVAYRFSGAGQPYEGLAELKNGHASWTGRVDVAEKHLLDPLKWGAVSRKCIYCDMQDHPCDGSHSCTGRVSRPRRIFVNSMSDLFHPAVPDEWIDRIFAVMALCAQHTFQALTKRPERMLAYMSQGPFNGNTGGRTSSIIAILKAMQSSSTICDMYQPLGRLSGGSLPNVWLGVSVENQATADERIPLLLETPAAVRFISAEPLFEEVIIRWPFLATDPHLDWVICGGESGPGARPMHPGWARSLRDQCVAAGTAFFMKQMGSAFGPNKGHDLPADLDIHRFPRGVPFTLTEDS